VKLDTVAGRDRQAGAAAYEAVAVACASGLPVAAEGEGVAVELACEEPLPTVRFQSMTQ